MKVFTVMSQEDEPTQGTVHSLWRSYDKALNKAIELMTALAKGHQIAGKWAWKVWTPRFPPIEPYSFTEGWEYRGETNQDYPRLRVWITEVEVQE